MSTDNEDESTPGGTRTGRSLADILRMHAERGKDGDIHITLSDAEEQVLERELDEWVCSPHLPAIAILID